MMVPPFEAKGKYEISQDRTLIMKLPGAGGSGDPHERDPALVLEDVLNDLVSIEQAETAYGVVIDPANQLVDLEATLKRREGS